MDSKKKILSDFPQKSIVIFDDDPSFCDFLSHTLDIIGTFEIQTFEDEIKGRRQQFRIVPD